MKPDIEWHKDNRELTNRILDSYARQCRFILEIGTGTSTDIFSKAVEAKDGKVWTMDVHAKTSPHDNVEVITGNSLALPWTRCIDLLYLDGCHKPQHVRKELEKFARWVNPGGFILFDDARCHEHPRLEAVVNHYCEDMGLTWYYPLPEPCGTAVIEVTRRLGIVPLWDGSSSTDCDFCGDG